MRQFYIYWIWITVNDAWHRRHASSYVERCREKELWTSFGRDCRCICVAMGGERERGGDWWVTWYRPIARDTQTLSNNSWIWVGEHWKALDNVLHTYLSSSHITLDRRTHNAEIHLSIKFSESFFYSSFRPLHIYRFKWHLTHIFAALWSGIR